MKQGRWGACCKPALVAAALVLGLAGGIVPALAAGTENSTVEQQVEAVVNADRTAAGLPALTVDPRLTAVAAARARYMLVEGFFSHCIGKESDLGCTQTGYDFPGRAEAAGIGVNQPGTTWEENLALNNYPVDAAAGQTTQGWLNSPGHRANMLSSAVAYTGVAAVCCFAGVVGGQNVTAADNVYIYVQEFTGGPGATPPAAAPLTTLTVGPSSRSGSGCQFVLGFAALAAELPQTVGQCTDEESHNLTTGDALQHTSTGGLLVWRKADNWTAFTDGYHTWINGPFGLAERLNTQRFRWEANPSGLAVVSGLAGSR